MRAPLLSNAATGLALVAAFPFAHGCAPHAALPAQPAAKTCGALPADPPTAHLIALSSSGDGSVTLVDRATLETVREVAATTPGRVEAAMPIAEDARHAAFWVANFSGGLGEITREGAPRVAETGAPLAGVAVSADGCAVAVAGARDLVLRLVDPETLKVTRVSLGNAADAPRHALAGGVASPHPLWLRDSSAVLVEDNIHEELLLVGRDGAVKARRAMHSAVHSLLLAPTGEILALEEGTLDGAVPPQIAVLSPPGLEIAREMTVPLSGGEPGRLHHGALSPDGETLVVANAGSPRGGDTNSVTAFHWRTGDRLWSSPAAPSAGHVAFLDAKRVIVVGHHAAEMPLFDAVTGGSLGSWPVLGTATLGHSLAVEKDGSVTILDSTLGALLRFKDGERTGGSERVGAGEAESSLPE